MQKIKNLFSKLTISECLTLIGLFLGALTLYFSFIHTPSSDLKVDVYSNYYQEPTFLDDAKMKISADKQVVGCPYQVKSNEVHAETIIRLIDDAKVYILISVKNRGVKAVQKATLLSRVPGVYELPSGDYTFIDCYGATQEGDLDKKVSSAVVASGGGAASIDLGGFAPDEVKQIHIWQQDYRTISTPNKLDLKILEEGRKGRVYYHIHANSWYSWLYMNFQFSILIALLFFWGGDWCLKLWKKRIKK